MPDDDTQQQNSTDHTDGQASSGSGAPQAGAQTSPGGGSDTGDDKPLSQADAAKLRKELSDVRAEAAASRVKLKEYEDANLSATEKLTKERDEQAARADQAEQRARDLQVRVIASELGVRKDAVADVTHLLDWSAIKDATDDKQVEAAVQALVKAKPYLSARSDGLDGGKGRNGAPQPTDANALIRQIAGRT